MSDTKGSTDGSFGERARYTFDDFTVDLARAELLHAGARVSLRPKSFDALRI